MKLLFNVDQTEALRRGIDAPNSTVQLEIDPGELTQIQRDVLAALMINGHDCTQKVLDSSLDKSQSIVGRKGCSFSCLRWSDGTNRLSLIEPSFDGVRTAIDELLSQRDRYIEVQRDERGKKIADIKAKFVEEMTAAPKSVWIYLSYGSSLGVSDKQIDESVSVRVDEWPHYPEINDSDFLDGEAKDAYEVARENASYCRDKLREIARMQLEKMRDEREAKMIAERDVLYSRLPETFRRRDAAGFSSDFEIKEAIIELMKKDAGYPETALSSLPFDHIEKSDMLSDEQFLKLQEIEKSAPREAEVQAAEGWDDDDDDDDDPDAGNEKYARISWTRGGVEAVVFVPLD